MIEENFTKSNLVALVYPKNDDYSIEKKDAGGSWKAMMK